MRWRVPVRWYLIALFSVPVAATLISLAIYGPRALAAPSGGWPRALAEVAAYFLLQLVLFQLAEEIGFTGFLQHHWQDRYSPMKLTLYVALLWALWHLPDHFAEEGWGLEQLISAPVVFAMEFVALFFARALFVWFYNRTGFSVLLVAIFHASFDASISQLSRDVVPASNTVRFLIFSGVILLFGAAVIIATKGQLGRRAAAVPVREEGDATARGHPMTLQEQKIVQDDRIRGTPEIGCRGACTPAPPASMVSACRRADVAAPTVPCPRRHRWVCCRLPASTLARWPAAAPYRSRLTTSVTAWAMRAGLIAC